MAVRDASGVTVRARRRERRPNDQRWLFRGRPRQSAGVDGQPEHRRTVLSRRDAVPAGPQAVRFAHFAVYVLVSGNISSYRGQASWRAGRSRSGRPTLSTPRSGWPRSARFSCSRPGSSTTSPPLSGAGRRTCWPRTCQDGSVDRLLNVPEIRLTGPEATARSARQGRFW